MGNERCPVPVVGIMQVNTCNVLRLLRKKEEYLSGMMRVMVVYFVLHSFTQAIIPLRLK